MKKALLLFATIILISVFLILPGCVSKPLDHFPANLLGMIYDDFNNPVDSVLIQLGPKDIFTSDLDGRFLLPSLNQEIYTITISKEGFEDQEIIFPFNDPMQILYIKMTSLRFLKEEIERNIHSREWGKCEVLIDRAFKLDDNDPVLIYLTAVYYYQINDIIKVKEFLRELSELGYHSSGITKLSTLVEERLVENESKE